MVDGAGAARYVEQGERQPTCLGHDPVADPIVDPGRHDRVQEFARGCVGQPAHLQLGQVAEHIGSVAYAEHQEDGFGEQPARDEAERLQRHLVEPLRVIDHAEQRLWLRRGGEQAEGRQADHEPVRRRSSAPAERHVERGTLRWGKLVEILEQRHAQLVQTSEEADAKDVY